MKFKITEGSFRKDFEVLSKEKRNDRAGTEAGENRKKSCPSDGGGHCVTIKSLFLPIRTREEERSKSHLSARVNTPEEEQL